MRTVSADAHCSGRAQRGVVSLGVAFLVLLILVAAVAGALFMSGSGALDSAISERQVAALFLAESGLERAQRVMASAAQSGLLDHTACNGLGTTQPLGSRGGTFALAGLSDPSPCTGATCLACNVQSTGTIPSTGTVPAVLRTINLNLSLTTVNGTSCNANTTDCTNQTAPPPTWSLSLKNPYSDVAIALFDLASRRQGNQTAAGCTDPACSLMWTVNAQNGVNSTGNMGNAVTLQPGNTYTIYQTLTDNRNIAEVGAFFPGSAPGPEIRGSYWDDTTPAGGGTKTVGRTADSEGQTNNGTATSSACTTTPALNSKQTCTSWCYRGDTLVFGFGGHAQDLTDELSSVTFNTAGTLSQQIALTRIAKFPNPSISGAPTDIYSEVWYVRNPNLSPDTAPEAPSASSYKGNGTGAIGATFTAHLDNGGSGPGDLLTVTSFPAYPSAVILPGAVGTGDTLTSSGGGTNVSGNPTILSQVTPLAGGEQLGGIGRYNISDSTQRVTSRSMTASSHILHVTACTICFFAPGDPIQGTTASISSGPAQGGVGDYLLSFTPPNANGVFVASGPVLAGSPGTTVYLPSSTPSFPIDPTTTTPPTVTIIAVASGTGQFAAKTTVASIVKPDPNPATKAFVVSNTPTTFLNLATICAGACAFFDHASSTTTYAIAKSANTDYWGSGFMCLRGADIAPVPITSSTVSATTWHEVVR